VLLSEWECEPWTETTYVTGKCLESRRDNEYTADVMGRIHQALFAAGRNLLNNQEEIKRFKGARLSSGLSLCVGDKFRRADGKYCEVSDIFLVQERKEPCLTAILVGREWRKTGAGAVDHITQRPLMTKQPLPGLLTTCETQVACACEIAAIGEGIFILVNELE